MKIMVYSAISVLAIGAMLSGCATITAKENPPEFSPQVFPAGQYTPKVDNFVVILDTSSSMVRENEQRALTARNLIGAINQSLPADLNFNAGLRTFGHRAQKWNKPTTLAYGMTQYSRSGLQKGLSSVNYAGGTSPLPTALEAAGKDLQGSRGTSAIIIVSDGLVEAGMSRAPAALAKLKAEMGDTLCTYTIAVGDNPAGEKFLQEVANADGCGFSETAQALAEPGQLGSFVESVFLERKNIPVAGAPATVKPRDGDGDGDGVLDSRDTCPATPKGVIVDESGCTLKLALYINFDFDKSEIKPEFAAELKKAGDFIRKNKDVPYILIAGFTDSVGENVYNQNLSERRAAAVKQYLVDNFAIDPNRLVARGSGETNPVADNRTQAGRAENRRGEIICCAIIFPEE
ncbi:MAG: OmpA family protein [Desulfuromonadales bacterium]|nr:OmpA family protein [Desulfuromonadales bacterium]MBN2645020.1 OmpA family protein [Desulfuromonadaceae bacterium]